MTSRALKRELKLLRQKVESLSAQASPWMVGEVLSVDTVNRTAAVKAGPSTFPVVPIGGSLQPEVGSTVLLQMNGGAPLVMPGHGAVTQAVNYTAGSAGYAMFDDGSAEFNNVVIRGILDAGEIRAGLINKSSATTLTVDGSTASYPTNLVPNGTFDVNTTGWSALTSCAIVRTTTAPQAGAGCLQVTMNATGGSSVITTTGTGGIAVTAGMQYYAQCYVKTAATGRSVGVYIRFYDSAGTLLTSWGIASGEVGSVYGYATDTGSWVIRGAYATAPPNAAYAAVEVKWLASANTEVHYVDTVSFSNSNYSFCPDVDIDGVYNRDEGSVIGGQTAIVGGGSNQIRGQGCQVADFRGLYGCPQLGKYVSGFTAGDAYIINMSLAASTTVVGRCYVSWYNSSGIRIETHRGIRAFKLDSSAYVTCEEAFIAPAGAVNAFIGFSCEPTGVSTSRNAYIQTPQINVYETTKILSGISSRTAKNDNGQIPTGMMLDYCGAWPGNSGVTAFATDTGQGEMLDGNVPMSGQQILRTEYPDLYAIMGTTNNAGYRSTDSDKFRVPTSMSAHDMLIVDQTTSAGVYSYTWAIQGAFRHLRIFIVGQSSWAGVGEVQLRLNTDASSANYFTERVNYKYGDAAVSVGAAPTSGIYIGEVYADSNRPVIIEAFVGDYRNTGQNKSVMFHSQHLSSLLSGMTWGGGVWSSTAEITRITIELSGASSAWVAGGHIEIWGQRNEQSFGMLKT